MEGLLWLLGFGVLFFLMMRYGCGAHIAHGGHGPHAGHDGHGGHASAAGGAKDPVCGMSVRANQGYSKAWSGQTYRFCSRNCLDQFEAAPERYATAASASS